MKQYLGYVLLVQIMIVSTQSFTSQSTHLSDWLREQQGLSDELNQSLRSNHVLISEILLHRQNVTSEMSLLELEAKKPSVRAFMSLYQENMYQDGFDKIWAWQERECLKIKEDQKLKLWKKEILSGERERKRRRIE